MDGGKERGGGRKKVVKKKKKKKKGRGKYTLPLPRRYLFKGWKGARRGKEKKGRSEISRKNYLPKGMPKRREREEGEFR